MTDAKQDDLLILTAVAESWAAIDGRTESFKSEPDGYLSDASAMIEGIERRGFKIVKA